MPYIIPNRLELLSNGILDSTEPYSLDIEQAFLDLGYPLFYDKATLREMLLEINRFEEIGAPVFALDDMMHRLVQRASRLPARRSSSRRQSLQNYSA